MKNKQCSKELYSTFSLDRHGFERQKLRKMANRAKKIFLKDSMKLFTIKLKNSSIGNPNIKFFQVFHSYRDRVKEGNESWKRENKHFESSSWIGRASVCVSFFIWEVRGPSDWPPLSSSRWTCPKNNNRKFEHSEILEKKEIIREELTLRLILSIWRFWFSNSDPMSRAMLRRFPIIVLTCPMLSSISVSRASLVILQKERES